eukprot:13965448-Ditylum_brightwellii.AAC.1
MQYSGGLGGGGGGGSDGHSGMHSPHWEHCHNSPQIEGENDDNESRKKLDEMISLGTQRCKSGNGSPASFSDDA